MSQNREKQKSNFQSFFQNLENKVDKNILKNTRLFINLEINFAKQKNILKKTIYKNVKNIQTCIKKLKVILRIRQKKMSKGYHSYGKNKYQLQNQISKRISKKSGKNFQKSNPFNQYIQKQNSQNDFQLQEKYLILDDRVKQQEQKQSERNSQQKQTNVEQLRSKLFQIQENVSKNSQKAYKNALSTPAIVELQVCLKLLQTHFPNIDLEKIIPKLHLLLDHNCTSAKISTNDDIQNGHSPVKQTKIAFQPNINFENSRNFQQKKVAESFISHGYGIRVLRDVVKDFSISPSKYNNIITTIMKNTFRTLESTIKKIRKKVVPIGANQERLLRAPLISCQKWLSPDELQTFYNFIRGIWGLGETNISTESASKLYNSFMRQLQHRELVGKSYKLAINNQQDLYSGNLSKIKVNDRR